MMEVTNELSLSRPDVKINHKAADVKRVNVTNHKISSSLAPPPMFSSLAPPPLFRWPAHAPALQSLQTRGLRELGIYREETQEAISQSGEKIKDIARKTGLGMNRKSIRICFDMFMAKSRPGLEISEEDMGTEKENVEMISQMMEEWRREKQFANVRR